MAVADNGTHIDDVNEESISGVTKKTHEVVPVSEALLHHNSGSSGQKIVLPYTRYDSVLGKPMIVDSQNYTDNGAPFHLYKVGTTKIPLSDIREMMGDII